MTDADRMEAGARVPGPDGGYGWVLVGAGIISLGYQAAVIGSRALFIVAIPDETGWSRASTSSAIAAFALGTGVWAPAIGWLMQRWGARLTMSLSAVVLASGLAIASRAREPLEFGLAMFLLAAPGSIGVGSLASFTSIQEWFTARRGIALALADSGASLGLMLVVPMVQAAIDVGDWRQALRALAAVGLVLVPLHWFLQRSPPADLGAPVAPAGPATDGRGQQAPSAPPLRALLGSRSFVLVVAGLTGIWTAQQVVTVHQAAYLADFGYSSATIAAAIASIGAVGLVGRPLFGLGSDRIGGTATFLLMIACVLAGIGSLVLAGWAGVTWMVWISSLAFGLSLGVGTLLFARQISAHFGQSAFSSIMGFCYLIGSAVAAAGAAGAGLAYEWFGSYHPAFAVSALAAASSAACATILGRFRPLPSRDASVLNR